ncbi:MAG: hypothetical protein R3199_07860 [Gemmatimonadota bacterium]|nr:hypothetical protein [Gemmatimonadota bacterium]
MKPTIRAAVLPVALALAGLSPPAASPSSGQTLGHALRTVDPEPIGPARAAVEIGAVYLPGSTFGASGLAGDLLRTPSVTARIGLGSDAEFEIHTGWNVLMVEERFAAPLADRLEFDGDATSDIADPVVSTKLRMLHEADRLPSLALRAATRLPVASNESGLGLDTTDFFLSLLLGKTVGRTRLLGNLGLGILATPTEATSQNDVLLYGLAAVHPLRSGLALVGEISGRVDPSGVEWPGLEDSGQARLGVRLGEGETSFDAALVLGTHEVDADVGLVVGLFRAFSLPR